MSVLNKEEIDAIVRQCGYPTDTGHVVQRKLEAMMPAQADQMRTKLKVCKDGERLSNNATALWNHDRAHMCEIIDVPAGPNIGSKALT